MIDKFLAARVLERSSAEIQRVLGDFDMEAQAALYLLERFIRPRPTMARINALRAEVLGNGHSLARHGMDLNSDALTTRLTKGVIAADFAPSDEGFATSFASVFAYNLTRASAIDAMTVAYTATRTELRPLIEAYDEAQQVVAGMEKPGRERGEMNKSRRTLMNACKKLSIQNLMKGNSLDFMPVVFNGKANPAQGVNFVNYPTARDDPRLCFVLKHDFPVGNGTLPTAKGETGEPSASAQAKVDGYRTAGGALKIGQGMKVQAAYKAAPMKVQNPKYSQGKPGNVWLSDQLEPMANIMGTKTTFNPPRAAFSLDGKPAEWLVPQHFPDNGEQGWRG